MSFNAGSVTGKILLDTTNWEKGVKTIDSGIKNTESKFQKFSKNMEKIGSNLTKSVTLPLVGLGVVLVKSASDAEEVSSKFANTFLKIGDDATKAAKNLSTAYGMSGIEAKKLLGNTADLLIGFGASEKASLGLSVKVQKLAADTASYNNVVGGAARASEILTKAMLGEREALVTLGIKISEADVKTKLLEKGQSKLTGRALLLAKANATLEIAYAQTAKAQGDAIRTSKSAANQFRRLQADASDLAVGFGKLLLPVVVDLVGVVRGAVQTLNSLDEGTKKTIIQILGLAAALGPAILIINKLIITAKTLGAVLTTSTGVIGAVVVGLGLLTAGIFAAKAQMDDLKKKGENVDAVLKKEKVTLQEVNKALSDQKSIMKTVVDNLGEGVKGSAAFREEQEKLSALRIKESQLIEDQWRKQGALNRAKRLEIENAIMLASIIAQNAGMKGDVARAEARISRLRTGWAQDDRAATIKGMKLKKTSAVITKDALEKAKQARAIEFGARLELLKLTGQNVKALEMEKQKKLESAKATGASAEALRILAVGYDIKIAKAKQAADVIKSQTDEEREIFLTLGRDLEASSARTTAKVQDNWKKTFRAIKSGIMTTANIWSQASSAITGVTGQFFENQSTEIQNDYINKKNYILANVEDEKEQKKQIVELDKEKNKKIAEANIVQFNVNKAVSVVDSVINTAVAVTKTLANPPLAIAIGILGAIQTGLILAQQPPAVPQFASGGIATAGTRALVGEEGPEMVQFNRTAQISNARDTKSMMTPDVKMVVNFNGPVNSEVDIDRVMNRAAKKLKNTLRGVV